MTPPYGSLILKREQDRLHDLASHLCIIIQGVFIASYYLAFGKVDTKPNSVWGMACLRADIQFGIPIVGPLEDALANKEPGDLDIDVRQLPPTFKVSGTGVIVGRDDNPARIKTEGLANTSFHLLTPLFVQFYETYRRWMFHKFNRDIAQWPQVWRFGRVVRNAISHGGKIKIDSQKEPPVQWRGLTYSAADNGKLIFMKDMAVGDLFLLILEMSHELDTLNCPLNPP